METISQILGAGGIFLATFYAALGLFWCIGWLYRRADRAVRRLASRIRARWVEHCRRVVIRADAEAALPVLALKGAELLFLEGRDYPLPKDRPRQSGFGAH